MLPSTIGISNDLRKSNFVMGCISIANTCYGVLVKKLDLNLLPLLQALLEFRNVSKAADRLGMSQPAMSAALAKLRRHFDDELLVRTGRSYALSAFGNSLVPMVHEAMIQIERATRSESAFNPSTSERSFVIAASDYAASLLVGPLRKILRDEAPNASVDIIPTSELRRDVTDYAKIDLLVGPTGYSMAGQSKQLFRDDFVALIDGRSPVLQRPKLLLSDLADLPHAVAYFGDGILTPADKLFRTQGIERQIAAMVTGFLPLPSLVEDTDLVALVPSMLAGRACRGTNLQILVFDSPAYLVEAMFWHPSRTDEASSSWLRSVLQRAGGELPGLFPAAPHPVEIHVPPPAGD